METNQRKNSGKKYDSCFFLLWLYNADLAKMSVDNLQTSGLLLFRRLASADELVGKIFGEKRNLLQEPRILEKESPFERNYKKISRHQKSETVDSGGKTDWPSCESQPERPIIIGSGGGRICGN